jgi:hypothetical protein
LEERTVTHPTPVAPPPKNQLSFLYVASQLHQSSVMTLLLAIVGKGSLSRVSFFYLSTAALLWVDDFCYSLARNATFVQSFCCKVRALQSDLRPRNQKEQAL